MFTIQKATTSHLEGLASVFNLYQMFYQKDSNAEGAKQFLKARMDNNESVIYVALSENDNEVIGFVQLYPLFSSVRMQKLWLLNDLYVKLEHRNKGISKNLIAMSKKLCKETQAAGLMLETGKNNTTGNQLYPATGFKLNTEHNFYYWDNIS